MEKVDVTPSLPINYEEAKSFFETGSKYEIYSSKKKKYLFSTVLGTGGVYIGPFFLKDSAEGMVFVKNYPLKKLINRLRHHQNIFRWFGNYVVFFDKWTSNHYHFHCDFLPRLMFFEKNEVKNLTLVLPDQNYMRKVAVPIIEMMGYFFKSILFIKENQNLFILSKIIYLNKTHHSGFSNAIVNPKVKTEIQAHTTSLPKTSLCPKIYVKRGNTYGRRVLNEPEIINFLVHKHQFTVVDFDTLDIKEAISLMQRCQILIGMHGAALTNAFYMPKNAWLMEFRWNGKHHNHCYWHLANSVGIKYYAIFGESDDETKILEGQGCNLSIPLSALQKALDTYYSLID
jgi:capsular polysaccharide biosynthesis protein